MDITWYGQRGVGVHKVLNCEGELLGCEESGQQAGIRLACTEEDASCVPYTFWIFPQNSNPAGSCIQYFSWILTLSYLIYAA